MREYRIYVTTWDATGAPTSQCWPYIADEREKGRMVRVASETKDTRLLPFFASETIGAARDEHRRLSSGSWMNESHVRAEVSALQEWERIDKGQWGQITPKVEGAECCRLGDWSGPSAPRELVEELIGDRDG